MGFARRVSLLVIAVAVTGAAVASAQPHPEAAGESLPSPPALPKPAAPKPEQQSPAEPMPPMTLPGGIVWTPGASEAEPTIPLPSDPSVPVFVEVSPCDSNEAEALRVHLVAERRRATTWNRVWRWTFTAAAVGSFGVGLANPFPSMQDGLYVSAGKAAIGSAARWIVPLRVDVPERNANTCADVAAVRKAFRATAKREKGLFIMGHIGGLALNLGGAALLWYRGSFADAALSVGVGYPVGLLSNYTMPRGTWHFDRDGTVPQLPPLDLAITPSPDGTGWFARASGAF